MANFFSNLVEKFKDMPPEGKAAVVGALAGVALLGYEVYKGRAGNGSSVVSPSVPGSGGSSASTPTLGLPTQGDPSSGTVGTSSPDYSSYYNPPSYSIPDTNLSSNTSGTTTTTSSPSSLGQSVGTGLLGLSTATPAEAKTAQTEVSKLPSANAPLVGASIGSTFASIAQGVTNRTTPVTNLQISNNAIAKAIKPIPVAPAKKVRVS